MSYIDDNAYVHPTAIIGPNVEIHAGAHIGPYCLIGLPAENLKTWPAHGKGVVIMSGAILAGHVTVDSGVERITVIGERAMLMKHVHIGHDSLIHDDCVLAPHVSVGGYVEMLKRCKVGMGTVIRNRKTIPTDVEIGMGSVVTRSCELWSNGIFAGVPVAFLKPRKETA